MHLVRRHALALVLCAVVAPGLSLSITTTAWSQGSDVTSLTAGPPTITSFSPTSGPVGTKVTIKGTGLAKASKVTFDNKVAKPTSDTATKIVVKVPTGAATGKIKVTTAAGTAASSSKFKVTS